jgi:Tfp pilus assembly protein PilO
MAWNENPFPLITILVLVTTLLVFAMKYFSAWRNTHADLKSESDYRALAEKAATAQAATAASLSALLSDFDEMKARLVSVEKMLRDVG